MIGTVSAQLEATLPVTLFGVDGLPQEIVAVIDTGYNAALALPMSIVTALALSFDARRMVTLGDRSRRVLDFYDGVILWNAQRRDVLVLAVEGEPLIGTALLTGCRLGADFVMGGAVTVERIT